LVQASGGLGFGNAASWSGEPGSVFPVVPWIFPGKC